ncbi:MAG: deoxyribodipyrimidine photo-lyase [Nitriliruptorales bacterium]|nr:deoxyribodipyrimidine photo-lyase [Nitriliruptorales bacterium]
MHLVLFTRDLRVHDHPGLSAAGDEPTIPLFVRDDRIRARAGPHRSEALDTALASLDASLRSRGSRLVLRTGDPVACVAELVTADGVTDVHVSGDVSAFASRREQQLRDATASVGARLHVHDGVTVVPPGLITPAGKDHYRVFTPYWRRWREVLDLGAALPAPRRIETPTLGGDPVPGFVEGLAVPVAEPDARARLDELLSLREDGDFDPDRLDRADSTRLSAALHFGTLSPTDLARWALAHDDEVLRQVCWRDLDHQLLAAHPDLPRENLRERAMPWNDDPTARRRWEKGTTGIPIVDAAMRELQATGWMHNRARMVVGSFLTKTLGEHWSHGAAHFERWLIDADLANNVANWQWIAGTGTDTRPNRVLNPVRQGRRFDPDGAWVRRWVPELSAIEGRAVHEPWRVEEALRGGYPDPIIEL